MKSTIGSHIKNINQVRLHGILKSYSDRIITFDSQWYTNLLDNKIPRKKLSSILCITFVYLTCLLWCRRCSLKEHFQKTNGPKFYHVFILISFKYSVIIAVYKSFWIDSIQCWENTVCSSAFHEKICWTSRQISPYSIDGQGSWH